MSPHEIWHEYVLYIGAGAVAAGGIVSLLRSLPVIVSGAVRGLKSFGGATGAVPSVARTDRDLPAWVTWVGMGVIMLAVWLAPPLQINLLGGALVVLFGFLFVTVSSRLTGEIGSSSNPISGMTIATLLLTALIFVALGRVSAADKITALSIAAVVCIASSNGGTTSQDLKTGYLLGATPSRQQIAILVGALSSALVIGFVILALNDAGTVFVKKDLPHFRVDMTQVEKAKEHLRGPDASADKNEYFVYRLREPKEGLEPGKYLVDDAGRIRYLEDPGINGKVTQRDNGQEVRKYSAPKATLMALIIDGIMSRTLPWGFVLIGAFIALVLELCGISSLAFAVGVYLPLSTSTPIMAGGVVRWIAERTSKKKVSAAEAESGPGVLVSSGLIAGGTIAGVIGAFIAFSDWLPDKISARTWAPGIYAALSENNLVPMILFVLLAGFLYLVANEYLLAPKKSES